MMSPTLEAVISSTRFFYESALRRLRPLRRYGKTARRVNVLFLLLLLILFIARGTYYIHTDPRIEPGSNIIAVAPLNSREVSKFDFLIAVLGITPQFANAPARNGLWARLKPGYDRDATTQANAVTFQVEGPGPSCRAYTLAVGQSAVHAAGDARITFLGMYSGLSRFDVRRLSREVTIDSGTSMSIPHTRVTVSVEPASGTAEPGNAEALGRTFTVSCHACLEQTRVKRTVVVDSMATLDGTELQVVRVSPVNVTFAVRNVADRNEEQIGKDCSNGR